MVEASATYIVQNEGRLPAWGRGTLTSAVQAELVRFVDDNDIRLTVTVPGSRTNTNPAGEQFILEGGGTVDRARPRTNGRSPEQRILNRTFQAVQSNQPTLTPQLQTSIFGSLNRAFSDRPTNSSPSRYNLAAARTALRGRSLTLGNLYAAIHDCNTANLDTICLDDIVSNLLRTAGLEPEQFTTANTTAFTELQATLDHTPAYSSQEILTRLGGNVVFQHYIGANPPADLARFRLTLEHSALLLQAQVRAEGALLDNPLLQTLRDAISSGNVATVRTNGIYTFLRSNVAFLNIPTTAANQDLNIYRERSELLNRAAAIVTRSTLTAERALANRGLVFFSPPGTGTTPVAIATAGAHAPATSTTISSIDGNHDNQIDSAEAANFITEYYRAHSNVTPERLQALLNAIANGMRLNGNDHVISQAEFTSFIHTVETLAQLRGLSVDDVIEAYLSQELVEIDIVGVTEAQQTLTSGLTGFPLTNVASVRLALATTGLNNETIESLVTHIGNNYEGLTAETVAGYYVRIVLSAATADRPTSVVIAESRIQRGTDHSAADTAEDVAQELSREVFNYANLNLLGTSTPSYQQHLQTYIRGLIDNHRLARAELALAIVANPDLAGPLCIIPYVPQLAANSEINAAMASAYLTQATEQPGNAAQLRARALYFAQRSHGAQNTDQILRDIVLNTMSSNPVLAAKAFSRMSGQDDQMRGQIIEACLEQGTEIALNTAFDVAKVGGAQRWANLAKVAQAYARYTSDTVQANAVRARALEVVTYMRTQGVPASASFTVERLSADGLGHPEQVQLGIGELERECDNDVRQPAEVAAVEQELFTTGTAEDNIPQQRLVRAAEQLGAIIARNSGTTPQEQMTRAHAYLLLSRVWRIVGNQLFGHIPPNVNPNNHPMARAYELMAQSAQQAANLFRQIRSQQNTTDTTQRATAAYCNTMVAESYGVIARAVWEHRPSWLDRRQYNTQGGANGDYTRMPNRLQYQSMFHNVARYIPYDTNETPSLRFYDDGLRQVADHTLAQWRQTIRLLPATRPYSATYQPTNATRRLPVVDTANPNVFGGVVWELTNQHLLGGTPTTARAAARRRPVSPQSSPPPPPSSSSPPSPAPAPAVSDPTSY